MLLHAFGPPQFSKIFLSGCGEVDVPALYWECHREAGGSAPGCPASPGLKIFSMYNFKGTVAPDFWGAFLACVDK